MTLSPPGPRGPRSPLLLLLLSLTFPAIGGCDGCASTEHEPARRAEPWAARRPPAPPTEGFVRIASGTFTMGSPTEEVGRYTNERQHEVTLTRPFELAATEVTQAQFEAAMGYNPSRFKGCPRCPVETISWHEAAAYCNALSRKRGLERCYHCTGTGPAVSCAVAAAHRGSKIYGCAGYRLPTDAEWEHAYRAGTSTSFYGGTAPRLVTSCDEADPAADTLGWYCHNAGGKTHEVGQKKQNPNGLFDMAGNVWEWCHDRYVAVLDKKATDPWGIVDSPMRVARGGSWKYFSRGMRAACRAWYKPGYRGARHGLRPARSL